MSEPTPNKDSLQVHHFHDRGDICLQATDGTLFYADSWRLSQASETFAHMLEIPQPAGTKHPRSRDELDPIPIDSRSDVLDLFLNVVSVSSPNIDHVPFMLCKKISLFCDKFEVQDRIASLFVKRVLKLAKQHHQEWDVLIWAGERNDVDMARRALKMMTDRVFIGNHHADQGQNEPENLPFWANFNQLPITWRTALFKVVLDKPCLNVSAKKTNKSSACHADQRIAINEDDACFAALSITKDWSQVASKFDPESA
ncbi:hypothetical protein CI109_106930 [Kwoniella shandongensis]|uniref:Uncharacterized protein n=1 Tax=Kwoniella shandongensis TaxID=1734106 RepID=A0A5M6CB21_9TREE|nr:uncharacterized protein CI109_000815 [Kwoniella shandongensis]KAA5530635.1 hypothetical protein CI109_000815 [Kwoniella shandongensis]